MSQAPGATESMPGRRQLWWLIPLMLAVGAGIGYAVYEAQQPPVHVELKDADFAGLDAAVTANKGSVVVVDFWATWCGPCRASFPTLVGLHKKYGSQGAAFISVSMEHNPAEDRDRALKFLASRRATFTHLLWTDETFKGAEGLENRFGYPGFIPYTALFGRDGGRIQPKDGVSFSPDELEDAIETALAKKSASALR